MIKEISKIEARGKYSGTKIHLTGEECKILLSWLGGKRDLNDAKTFTKAVGKAIRKLKEENPYVLEDRTEEEIAAALQRDKDKIEKQMKVMKEGGNWKKVK